MIDFSNQKDNIEKYKLPTKTLEDCPETLKLLLEENDNSNPYISLGRVFELYEQGAKEEHADWYFYKYLDSLETKDKYTFSIGETKIEVPINVMKLFIMVKHKGSKKKVINPHWHLMISYYAYIDAMYNHNDNEYAVKIKEMPGHPSGNFGIRCKSVKQWKEEAF